VGEREYLYVFFGRCRPYKGLEALIEAFAAAPPPARLLIVGNFASPAYLASISALARPVPGVEIVPRSIPDADIQLYLNAADCVVLPYRAVLTSGAALLAMSFGRPVIAPDLGAMRDHVDADCGLLYPAEQPLGLQLAMRDVRLRSFDADLILERARRFTWPQMAGLLLDLFDGGQAKPEPGAAR
jgi:glycosyltransferase involved in cell wall biosynthesis